MGDTAAAGDAWREALALLDSVRHQDAERYGRGGEVALKPPVGMMPHTSSQRMWTVAYGKRFTCGWCSGRVDRRGGE
ncbi:hypothetical protein [Phytohabitans houttuyneae]|uniref:hypothetical protein n=1 Tax=Phytohabitans houttuyneae TaxID=1076126 RepID=UPI001565A5F1|nr:hypothetical protein [Phytohabitans houttuyneae]